MNLSARMLELISAIVAAEIAVSASEAQSVPIYDIFTYCLETGDPDLKTTRENCIERQQAAYESLLEQWPRIDPYVRRHCDEMAQLQGGTYLALQACVNGAAGGRA